MSFTLSLCNVSGVIAVWWCVKYIQIPSIQNQQIKKKILGVRNNEIFQISQNLSENKDLLF